MTATLTVKESMHLAGDNLMANLDPQRDYLPIFHTRPHRDGSVSLEAVADDDMWPGHNLGRWWDAILRLENAAAYAIPKQIEATMRQHLDNFFDNPDHFCLAPVDSPLIKPRFDFHSLREGLLGLNALIAYRQCPKATAQAHAMVRSILRLSRVDGSWKLEESAYAQQVGLDAARESWAITNGAPAHHGRLIEALVLNYQLTGDPEAMRAADRFARYHLKNTCAADGSLGSKPGNHSHSWLGTLRGLLLFGEISGQREYIDTVVQTYYQTMRKRIKKSGFISHDMDKDFMGETTSPGDIAQLALWLAVRHQHVDLFDDVERIVRARLLPSQLISVNPNTQKDYAPMLRGAYGGMYMEAHGGKIATFDVTAAVLHSMIDIYKHIVEHREQELCIHLHFDYEDERVAIYSRRDEAAQVMIDCKESCNVLLRMPRWAPRDSIAVNVDGKTFEPQMLGDYVLIPKNKLPGKIIVHYATPYTREVEATNNVDYTFDWLGDEIIGVSPNTDFYPFYVSA